MVRRILLIALGALLPVTAAAGGEVTLTTSTHRYVADIEPVEIILRNDTSETVTTTTWTIHDLRAREPVAEYRWDGTEIQPGEELTWSWTQERICEGVCPEPWPEEERTYPGRYSVVAKTSTGNHVTHFRIGQYFRLGFEAQPALSFTVFVDRLNDINKMTEEALAVDKTKIVSGLVRKQRSYNPDWNFTMGPGSIILGEVFVEVCDASPSYVQRHRADWLGRRWCPWDSYVAAVGR